MIDSIEEILADTPWWVFLLFTYLMWVGFSATKPHQVHIKTLMLFPVMLFVFSIMSLFAAQFTVGHFLLWLSALGLGTSLGWLHYQSLRIKADKHTKKILVPGTWILLLIILCVFIVKFYFGYELAIHPHFIFQPKYYIGLLLVYGLLTGLFLGRFLYARHCLRAGPYLETPTS